MVCRRQPAPSAGVLALIGLQSLDARALCSAGDTMTATPPFVTPRCLTPRSTGPAGKRFFLGGASVAAGRLTRALGITVNEFSGDVAKEILASYPTGRRTPGRKRTRVKRIW